MVLQLATVVGQDLLKFLLRVTTKSTYPVFSVQAADLGREREQEEECQQTCGVESVAEFLDHIHHINMLVNNTKPLNIHSIFSSSSMILNVHKHKAISSEYATQIHSRFLIHLLSSPRTANMITCHLD